MFQRIFWKDHLLDGDGKVIQQGTNLSESNFNKEEEALYDAHVAASILIARTLEQFRMVDDEHTAETGEVELTNSLSYPFNNSIQTVSLKQKRMRNDYTITCEIKDHTGGIVGDIVITDKLSNGFKIAFTGDAKYAKVSYKIQGGGKM